jgi:hypothetical protein
VLIFIGVFYFQYEEGWTLVDSFYFTVMTLTSVGYGDFVPTHDMSKIVTALYSMVSIPLAVFALGVIAKTYFEERISSIENRMSEILTREKVLEEDVEEAVVKDNSYKK